MRQPERESWALVVGVEISSGWVDSDRRNGSIWFHPTLEPQEIVIENEEPVSYVGHWVGYRVTPCSGSDCQSCHREIGSQRRFVIAIGWFGTERHGAWEFGSHVGARLRELGKLQGRRIRVWRASEARRARTEIEAVGMVRGLDRSQAVEVVRVLEALWEDMKRF